jgi:GABA(A) receptor-associated protein
MIYNLKKNIENFVKIIKKDKDLNIYTSNYKYITKFRKQKLEERIKLSEKIMLNYPQRVPIIVDNNNEIDLDKNKYIVPNNLTVGQFMYILRQRIKFNYDQSIFLICNNELIFNSELIISLYNKHKDYDGFLYLIISLENTFGN